MISIHKEGCQGNPCTCNPVKHPDEAFGSLAEEMQKKAGVTWLEYLKWKVGIKK